MGPAAGGGGGCLQRDPAEPQVPVRDGPALRPDHPGPRGQITRGSGHSWAGQGDLRETGEEAPNRAGESL